jgi:hypothetical protein
MSDTTNLLSGAPMGLTALSIRVILFTPRSAARINAALPADCVVAPVSNEHEELRSSVIRVADLSAGRIVRTKQGRLFPPLNNSVFSSSS